MKIIKGNRLEYRQFIVNDEGLDIQVRYNQDIELYKGTDVTVYEYTASEGSKKKGTYKEVTRYAVAIDDAIRATRTSVKQAMQDRVDNLLAQGLITDEVAQALLGGK